MLDALKDKIHDFVHAKRFPSGRRSDCPDGLKSRDRYRPPPKPLILFD